MNCARVLSSLTYDDVQAITAMLDSAAPDWKVDLLEDYRGYLSVLVSMKTEAAESQPCYLISGPAQQTESPGVRDNAPQQPECVGSLDDVLAWLLAALNKEKAVRGAAR